VRLKTRLGAEALFGLYFINLSQFQSTEVLEFVKKDLGEFGNAVKNEANNVVSTAGTAVEKTFNVSASCFSYSQSQVNKV